MPKHGKKFAQARTKVPAELKLDDATQALTMVKEAAFAKFDETVEVAVRLGVDPRHADQVVRGTVVLPHGTGKTVRVLVLAQGEKEKEARDAGADHVGLDNVQKIKDGWLEFDAVVATPDVMGQVGQLGVLVDVPPLDGADAVLTGQRVGGDHRLRAGHLAADPADLGDQLGHGVLAGDRVVEDGGVQRAPGLALDRAGCGDHVADHLEDPLRTVAGRQPAPPVRQGGGIEALRVDGVPTCRLPPQVEGQRLDRLAVGMPVERLQHDHRGDHLARDRGPAPPRGKQVGEQLRREQPGPMLGQQREHTAWLE